MTPVPVHLTFFAATAGTLLVMLGLWLRYMVGDGLAGRSRRRPMLYRCEMCAHVYEDRRNVPLAACPRCGSLNETVKR